MNFAHFKLAYKSLILILTLTMLLVLFLWIKNSFHYFVNSHILDLLFSDNNTKMGYEKGIVILKAWGHDTLFVLLKLIILKGIGSLVKRIIVPTSWIAHWDNSGDISTVFGRNLTQYFRHNTYINFKRIVTIHDYSQNELKMISNHNKNPNMAKIFEKYDDQFGNDLKSSCLINDSTPTTHMKNNLM